jgi:hypothetical protein
MKKINQYMLCFLLVMIFILLVTNTIACSVYNEDVQSVQSNRKYYLYLDQRIGPLIIRFNTNNNTFHMRRMPTKPFLFNYKRSERKEGVYVFCEDLLRLFWYEKFSRKKRLLYEVEAKIYEDFSIKAVSVKTKKC